MLIHGTASLVTAIVFHQLFEGLSLGIRIATLPAAAARRESDVMATQERAADLKT